MLGEGKQRDLEIRISFDEEERTLTIKDSGTCDAPFASCLHLPSFA